MSRTNEDAFETVIEAHLLQNGYQQIAREGFDRERAIFPETVLAFIRETQPKEWARLEALHGDKTGEQILGDLCKWMDANGALATLRHGFKCYGRTLHAAFFKAAHELNPELEARYAANRLGLTRQLHFSPRSEQSLDVTLSLNGIPVATVELKNPLTGQTIEEARRQYKLDRDPREPIFEFKRRTLVHFAADTESVLMTTRLAGSATHFLPFNKGCDGAAGNPPDPAGRTYRTAYLWEEVLQRDSLLDLLARFIHLQTEEKRDDQGRKVKTESMIFPRHHQLQAVRMLVDAEVPFAKRLIPVRFRKVNQLDDAALSRNLRNLKKRYCNVEGIGRQQLVIVQEQEYQSLKLAMMHRLEHIEDEPLYSEEFARDFRHQYDAILKKERKLIDGLLLLVNNTVTSSAANTVDFGVAAHWFARILRGEIAYRL
jgi:hypothetical protein